MVNEKACATRNPQVARKVEGVLCAVAGVLLKGHPSQKCNFLLNVNVKIVHKCNNKTNDLFHHLYSSILKSNRLQSEPTW